jgi:MFS family permease
MTSEQVIAITATIIGSVVGPILLSLVNYYIQHKPKKGAKASRFSRPLWQILGLGIIFGATFGLILGLLIPRLFESDVLKVNDPENREQVLISITEPLEGAEMSEFSTIRGTYTNLPSGWQIWVVTQPLGTFVWFPQERATIKPVDKTRGEWSVLAYFYGQAGQQYQLAVLLADPQTSEMLFKKKGAVGIQIDAVPYDTVIVEKRK